MCKTMPKLIYLASPYTHSDMKVVEARVQAVNIVAANMMSESYTVFSPVVHSHYIADNLPKEKRFSFDFWMAQDLPILRKCDEVHVLMLSGWENSRGIKEEIRTAEECGIPVIYTPCSAVAQAKKELEASI